MMRFSTTKFCSRHAFSLIEVVIAVVILAIAVPPTLNLMDTAAAGRVDAINTTRATMLATCVLETILADLSSNEPSLGFDAFTDQSTYLNDPDTGLVTRLSPTVAPYIEAGFKYGVTIGSLVGSDGTVSANPDENLYRVITVRVGYPSASSTSYELPVSIMVSER